MNGKNILIAISVFGIGLILYKFLLGFILPIVLLVSLGYVLKFLLKGSELDSGQNTSQIQKKNTPSTPLENIVEIKPWKSYKVKLNKNKYFQILNNVT